MSNVDRYAQELGEERVRELSSIGRYNMYQSFYRSSILQHAQRVEWRLLELAPLLDTSFALERARILAQIHDDREIPTGDIQAGHKAVMSQQMLANIDK